MMMSRVIIRLGESDLINIDNLINHRFNQLHKIEGYRLAEIGSALMRKTQVNSSVSTSIRNTDSLTDNVLK